MAMLGRTLDFTCPYRCLLFVVSIPQVAKPDFISDTLWTEGGKLFIDHFHCSRKDSPREQSEGRVLSMGSGSNVE